MAGEAAKELIRETVERMLSGRVGPNDVGASDAVRAIVEPVFAIRSASYRDALLIQLAYRLAEGEHDATRRHEGGRGVAGWLGSFLHDLHISAVKDAFQNVGKNSATLTRGNEPDFDAALAWSVDAQDNEVRSAFNLVAATIAASARPVLPMPPLARSRLTFAAVSQLLDDLCGLPSGGAYEQFTVAALLHGMVAMSGVPGLRVQTKSVNASDASSRVAGDVQVLTGQVILEAIEVTANNWTTKLPGAEAAVREHDLSRIQVVADTGGADRRERLGVLAGLTEDASALDLTAFRDVVVAFLRKEFRAAVLLRLYELIDRKQSDVSLVNQYVRLIRESGVAAE